MFVWCDLLNSLPSWSIPSFILIHIIHHHSCFQIQFNCNTYIPCLPIAVRIADQQRDTKHFSKFRLPIFSLKFSSFVFEIWSFNNQQHLFTIFYESRFIHQQSSVFGITRKMLSRVISYLVVVPSVCAITLRAFEVNKTDAKNLINSAMNMEENYYRVDRHGFDIAKSVNATKAAFQALREAIEGNIRNGDSQWACRCWGKLHGWRILMFKRDNY